MLPREQLPGGMAALFGLPVGEFSDLDFDAEGVIGRGVSEQYQRLGAESSLEARASVADENQKQMPAPDTHNRHGAFLSNKKVGVPGDWHKYGKRISGSRRGSLRTSRTAGRSFHGDGCL